VSVAARQLEGELAALRLGPAPLVHAGFEQMEFRFTDRSLKPQQKAIIQRIRVVDPLRVAEQRIAQRTDLKQLVPIATGAGEAGHFHAEHHADAPQSNLGHETLKPKTPLR
jgi:hypothetical protein